MENKSAQQAEAKKALRVHMRSLRTAQDLKTARQASLAAQKHLLASPLWQEAQSVALYQATQGEMETDLLFAAALRDGRKVCFPRVRRKEPGMMDFVPVKAKEDLVPGSFGILEPAEDLVGLSCEDYICDVAVIPGVAFSAAGLRLGFGGGFYDRYFAKARAGARVGFCFSFQLAQDSAMELVRDPWDVSMTHICTENGLLAAVRQP